MYGFIVYVTAENGVVPRNIPALVLLECGVVCSRNLRKSRLGSIGGPWPKISGGGANEIFKNFLLMKELLKFL